MPIPTLPPKEKKVTPPRKLYPVSNITPSYCPKTYSTYIDALLLSDLSTNVGSGIEVDWANKVDKTTQAAAITYRLCSLTKHVARAKVGDDTYQKVNVKN